MAISIHSNRFAAAYHNMSAPPRTTIELQGEVVSGAAVVFSLPYAMLMSDLIDGIESDAPNPLEEALEIHNDVRNSILRGKRTPEHLFRKIGSPIFPIVECNFLIGWRPLESHAELNPLVCTDPRLCAGVLSRCAGVLYLPDREPNLTWDHLLSFPIAFDDSALRLP
jgi:hypothetical protein